MLGEGDEERWDDGMVRRWEGMLESEDGKFAVKIDRCA
jgi:hypothetical protein